MSRECAGVCTSVGFTKARAEAGPCTQLYRLGLSYNAGCYSNRVNTFMTTTMQFPKAQSSLTITHTPDDVAHIH